MPEQSNGRGLYQSAPTLKATNKNYVATAGFPNRFRLGK